MKFAEVMVESNNEYQGSFWIHTLHKSFIAYESIHVSYLNIVEIHVHK